MPTFLPAGCPLCRRLVKDICLKNVSQCQDCLHCFIKERESLHVRQHCAYYRSETAACFNGKFLQCLLTHAGYMSILYYLFRQMNNYRYVQLITYMCVCVCVNIFRIYGICTSKYNTVFCKLSHYLCQMLLKGNISLLPSYYSEPYQ